MRLSLLISIFIVFTGLQSHAQSFLDAGNRYISGGFDLTKSSKYKISLGHIPVRINVRMENGSPAIYTLAKSGKVYKTLIIDGKTETKPTAVKSNPYAKLSFSKIPSDASRLSAPMETQYGLIYINLYGDLVVNGRRFDINATDDNEIAVAGKYAVVLIEPTNRYTHGVLGDKIESAGFAVIDLETLKIITKKFIDSSSVIEQKGALLADLNEDGEVEVVLTVSNEYVGAQVQAFSLKGDLVFSSNPIGTGYRWRHVFAAAKFDDGMVRLVDDITPHIGGILEFLEAVNGKLIRKSSIAGVSSHTLGSTNLGMGLVVDIDGDAMPEVLIPAVGKTKINAYKSDCSVVEIADFIIFDGTLSTEITALPEGKNIRLITFGTDSGDLYIYVSNN